MTETDLKTAVKSLLDIPEVKDTGLIISYRGVYVAWIKPVDPTGDAREAAKKIISHLNKSGVKEISDLEPPKIRKVSGKTIVDRDTFLIAINYDFKIDFVEKKTPWVVFENGNLTGLSNRELEDSFTLTYRIGEEKGSNRHLSEIEGELGGDYRVIRLWKNDLNGPVFELAPQIRAGNSLAGCIAIRKDTPIRAEDIIRTLNRKIAEKRGD